MSPQSAVRSPQLRKSISLAGATSLVVGIIIGTSIFVQPSIITSAVPFEGGVMFVWLAAGALTLCGALICAELSSALPGTGGVYVYLREAFSPALGFLWGWAMFWTMHTGIIAAIAVIVARYIAWFAPMGGAGIKLTAMLAIVVLSAVNWLGVRQGSRTQTAFTVGKLVAIALVIVLGFALGPRTARLPDSTPSMTSMSTVSAGAVLDAVGAGLFAYGGWHMVTYSAGETVDAERTLPRALVLGTAIVTLCYIGMNAAYLHVLPLRTVAASTQIAADAANAVLGAGGGSLMSALVIFSGLGALSGIILAGPRVYLAMAHDGVALDALGRVHATRATPHIAIAAQAAWACVLVLTGSYRALFTRVVYTEWIFFALMAVGLLLLRKRADWRPAYRAPGGAVIPLLFALAGIAVAVEQVVSQPLDAMIELGLVVIGWPVYLYAVRQTPEAGRPTPNITV